MAGERIMNYFERVEKNASSVQPSGALPEGDLMSEVGSPKSQVVPCGMHNALEMARKVQLLSLGEHSPADGSNVGSSLNRDLVLAKLNKAKILSLIKAWEEGVIKKSEHSYNKKVVEISAWEVAKKARADATLKSCEERIENEKAAYLERTRNKIALVQRIADEQRALAEAKHGQEVLEAEEIAAKWRASGTRPRKFIFWS